MAQTDGTVAAGTVGKSLAASDMLAKLARTQPYYKRNRPHICSFWVKGECKRGEECPYRHDKPNEPDDPLSEQNIRDRYYGVNDPVADKLLKRAASLPRLNPPEDKTITTLYVGNLGDHITEVDIRDNLYQYGEIRTVSLVPRQQCAFVQFTKRASAEMAAEKTFNKLVMGGKKLSIKWAHSQAKQGPPKVPRGNPAVENIPGLPPQIPLPPPIHASDFVVMPSGMKVHSLSSALYGGPSTSYAPPPSSDPQGSGIHYPSQNPNRLGATQK